MRPLLTPLEAVYGEICALQVVVQRLVGQMALSTGHDLQKVMSAEHAQASDELLAMDLGEEHPDRVEAIRAHAQTVLDQIYVVASTTRKANPKQS